MSKDETMKSERLSRREFIRSSVATAGSAAVVANMPLSLAAASRQDGKSAVIKVVSDKVLDGKEVTAKVNKEVVAKMIEAGMKKLTGKETLEEALGVFVRQEDVVGLKVNCLGTRHLSTHTQIPEVLSGALLKLGLPAERILVFDRYGQQLDEAGYVRTKEVGKIHCLGFDDDMDEEAPYTTPDGQTTTHWPKILTKRLTRIINLPVMKNHSISGVTLSLKNIAFGLLHPTSGTCHSDCCAPFIADVCSQKLVTERWSLSILDGILCGFDGGPGKCTDDKKEVNNALYFSLDPVARCRAPLPWAARGSC
ncbi:MAG: DUF362 domain-containing protein [Planctomycetes bacterium]|nr:DUF362 domain-containing protein [Planctomycetota bacterium]